MRNAIFLMLVMTMSPASSQRVLHFSATSGFDHGTRAVSFAMFTDIGSELGSEVINDPLGATFSDPIALAEFDVVIFSNTSGNNILDAEQRANFEQWVQSGGSILGIHAATDTYRHSTANGNNTGTWDFYAELIGASVQEGPNHVNGTPQYAMSHIGIHPSTAALPDPWVKSEEYYYWEGGYFRNDNIPVLEVEQTIGPNGQVNSYDAPRPMSWYRELPDDGRAFYTALGHAPSNFTDDPLFRQHLKDALLWLIDASTSIKPQPTHDIVPIIWPNPAASHVIVKLPLPGACTMDMLDAQGRSVLKARFKDQVDIDLSRFPQGLYILHLPELSSSTVMVIDRPDHRTP